MLLQTWASSQCGFPKKEKCILTSNPVKADGVGGGCFPRKPSSIRFQKGQWWSLQAKPQRGMRRWDGQRRKWDVEVGVVLEGWIRAERCPPLSHSPRLRKVMPFVTCEWALPRAVVKVLLYPVGREQDKKQRAGMPPKAVTLSNALHTSACDTDKASSFDFWTSWFPSFSQRQH